MKKVITYGTYDLLHEGHIRLLERAKALGDYLVVGITADSFDRNRGKINVIQSLSERIDSVRATGIADEIIVEEYEGQKIEDIQRLEIDVFTVGSDWEGKFDYLKEYCEVIYLDRTEGISSTDIRSKENKRLGIIGEIPLIEKYLEESRYVNGLEISGLCSRNDHLNNTFASSGIKQFSDYNELLDASDAVFIASNPSEHYTQIREALTKNVHVLCESPIAISPKQCEDLFRIANQNCLVIEDAIKTAYATAYDRMILLAKSGTIGDIISIDSTCTSLKHSDSLQEWKWGAILEWGPTALLPILQLLGETWGKSFYNAFFVSRNNNKDGFVQATFSFNNAVASLKVGNSVKSEGNLIISGTTGYIYVPAPWWKTDYFEVRREDPNENKRYFYSLDGEGIRYELVAFLQSIKKGKRSNYISFNTSIGIAKMINEVYEGKNVNTFVF